MKDSSITARTRPYEHVNITVLPNLPSALECLSIIRFQWVVAILHIKWIAAVTVRLREMSKAKSGGKLAGKGTPLHFLTILIIVEILMTTPVRGFGFFTALSESRDQPCLHGNLLYV